MISSEEILPEEIQAEQKQFEMKNYLAKYLELKEGDIDKIDFIDAKNLTGEYKKQFDFMHDERLENIKIGIVPDNLWVKGKSSSESHAENNLILFRQSSFQKDQNNPNNIAWMVHELAHCLNYLDDRENYQNKMQKFAFEDLKSQYSYPNNKVEQYTFTKQFEYLKNKDFTKENIFNQLKSLYQPEDLPFFEKLLGNIYK